ncbi:hypothetical protein Syun_019718 [Stephania yunnanensis]|uniref:Uncharacterized protein n=1 Tax=Stephania yunnanensis TaxID=152371 RepID=A0AAP0IX09_9MAGN
MHFLSCFAGKSSKTLQKYPRFINLFIKLNLKPTIINENEIWLKEPRLKSKPCQLWERT